MTSRSKNYVPLLPLAVLLAFATAPKPQITGLTLQPAAAQSSPADAFPLPTSVPQGTKVVVDSSSAMQKISEALKQSFETQYPGTSVTVTPASSDEAVAAVAAGKADLAAIGRPLTEAEKAQGLVAVPVSRNKIAMIVGPESPFKSSLTVDQFAQIFRGEVTNWSQVGGSSAPVRLVDRPATSDTRQAFQNYPVFQKAPFKTGSTAVQVEDSTEAVIAKLGQDGLGYAIADQVVDQPNVRIVPMHNTPPTDPKYPFSQSLYYIYKGPTPSTGAKAFLGFAVTPANQRIIEAARTETAPAATSPAPETTASPQAPAPATTTESNTASPWWWLLLPIIGIPLVAWLFKRNQAASVAAPVAAPVSDRNRIILTPRNCRDAYAYWELPDAKTAEARNLALRLYDVTGIDLDRQQ
ncbi:MAG: substrate-binding domain-containing protein, partial [Leptodesmis sp.]|uniref:substrate-binding domain-containing protein n=1 Tax=Leptodesmis sp. TaxID=3100501 RepID=UPI003D1342D7